MKSDKLKWKYC